MSEPAPSFDPAAFIARLGDYGHGGALGISYVDHGADWCALSLPYDERLVAGPNGILASGPIVSLMDMATSLALWVRMGRFRAQATLDLRVDYLRPATPERAVIGRGECHGVTRSVGFVRGTAHNGDPADPVAHVSGTFMFTD